MHWRHVSITTTPCWGSRLVALRAHVLLAERIGAHPLSQCAHPGQLGGEACRGLPSECMLGNDARGVPRLTPTPRGRPSVTSYAYGLLKWNYTYIVGKMLRFRYCTVRAPVFDRHQFFGTSEHYGKTHGSLVTLWMNYNYTACCGFPTSTNILILPSQFWQIGFESYCLYCSKCRILHGAFTVLTFATQVHKCRHCNRISVFSSHILSRTTCHNCYIHLLILIWITPQIYLNLLHICWNAADWLRSWSRTIDLKSTYAHCYKYIWLYVTAVKVKLQTWKNLTSGKYII